MRNRMKEFRARYQMTQDELAKTVGVTRKTIVYIEKGDYNPSLLLAYQIAKALETNIYELFIFEE